MDGLGGILGDLGRALGWSWRDLGRSWAVLEGSWAIFGGLLGGLGGILAGLGRILDDLERYFGRSWEDHRFLLVGGSIFGTRQAIVHKNMQPGSSEVFKGVPMQKTMLSHSLKNFKKPHPPTPLVFG